MIPHEMKPGRRHKGGKPGDQFKGLEDYVRGSVAPAVLEPIEQPAVGQKGQTLGCDRRATRVAKKLLQSQAVTRRNADIGMKAEA